MIKAIKYNLSHALDLTGRDARSTFWYYVLFLIVAQFLIGFVAAIPMTVSMMSQAFEAASQGVNTEASFAAMIDTMVEQMRVQMIVGIVLGLAVIGLLTASFVRRLHDAGGTGWIAVLPIAAHLFSMAYTYTFFDRIEEIMRQSMPGPNGVLAVDPFAAQAEMGALGFVGWIGTIIVIGFGVLKSQDGPNKHGDAPVKF